MKLALGTVQFGVDYGISNQKGQTSLEEVKQILRYANKHHLELLDTAAAYGESELVLGNCGLEHFKIVSKLPPVPKSATFSEIEEFAENTLEQSLKNLNAEKVYGYLLHSANDIMLFPTLYDWLESKKEQGIIKKIGVSVYNPIQAQNIIDKFDIDLIQIPLNLLDQRFISSGVLNKLKKKGIEVHVRSVFLQGLLLMEERPVYFKNISHLFDKLESVATEYNIHKAAITLNFVAQLQQVDRVIVGVNELAHLKQLITLFDTPLPDYPWHVFSCNDEHFINPSLWQI
ncbi:aldo/keto reductase [Pseudoalteromonas sp.]|uniref:aldo/keto reductase n=1 Tax=Pseudoalteromonas sp. TaxID=53249 RepID=UPI003565CC86